MKFKESIILALDAIKINKLRSLLTMLGIIIGISSVITISAIGSSAQGFIQDELKGAGYEEVSIYPNWEKFPDYVPDECLITEDEALALEDRFEKELVFWIPNAYVSGQVKGGRKTGDANLRGVADGYDKYTGTIKMVEGRFINERDVQGSSLVAVIPEKAAKDFFGNSSAVGKTIQLTIDEEMVDLKVVGVYTEKASKLESLLEGGNSYMLFVPYSMITGKDFSTMYLLCILDTKDVDGVSKKMVKYLTKIKHIEEDTLTFNSAQSNMEQINSILNVLSMAIAAIAAISLLVGGIGIMNIMLVSVTERTREIGIRKALGAMTKDIMRQFLIEAVILSCIGGIIGILQGIGVAAIVAAILDTRLVISVSSVIISVTFSIIVGIVFGLFPAKKAAKLDPIEALRYE